MPERRTMVALAGAALWVVASAAGAEAPKTAGVDAPATALREIREEAARKNRDPIGRPLPLVAHWNRGSNPAGFSPTYQLDLIRKGSHLMPWFEMPRPKDAADRNRYFQGEYLEAFKQVARWKLPFTLVGTQWEMVMSKSRYPGGPYPWKKLPPEQNPNVIGRDGKVSIRHGLSPFGPTKPWKQVGAVWVGSGMLVRLQQLYPDPPRVIFLSNNEASKLRWHKEKRGGVEVSKRYMDRYGAGRPGGLKRKVVGDGWIERYKVMLDSMRAGLVAPGWRNTATFVAYGGVGISAMSRWSGWPVYSLHCKGRYSPWPYVWDGGSPSYYTHNWDASTDFRVQGPQVEFMNFVMALRQTYRHRPEFWFEFSVWDGSLPGKKNDKWAFYARHGEKYTPVRHGSYVEFGMWLTRPRLVREWRGYLDTRERIGAYFEAIVKVVDRVYADPVLRKFWRKGELVPNRAQKHPYQVAVPDEYKREDRWYLLGTNLDPKRPWKLDTEIPVFSLARVLGAKPNRQWLVYARSPLADRKKVKITIPRYETITVDVPIAGAFYDVQEAGGTITRVGAARNP